MIVELCQHLQYSEINNTQVLRCSKKWRKWFTEDELDFKMIQVRILGELVSSVAVVLETGKEGDGDLRW